MSKTEKSQKQNSEMDENSSLKGTLVSVSFLGAFIVVTWLCVYFLFLNRI